MTVLHTSLPAWLAPVVEQVRRHWGTHLYVRVVPKVTPCMDWREVQIPPEAETWSRDRLTSILLHEWGHRMISPVSPRRGALWAEVASQRRGLSKGQARVLVNVATDLWIDRSYLESPEWGGLYARGEAEGLRELEERLRGGDPGKGVEAEGSLPSAPGLGTFLLAFYHRLLRDCAPSGALPSGALADPRALDDMEDRVDRAWMVLYDSKVPELDRVLELAGVLRDLLPEEPGWQAIWTLIRFSRHMRNAGRLSGRLLEEAEAVGLRPSELEDALGPEAQRLRRQQERLKMYARVVPAVEALLRRRSSARREGYRMWYPGRPLPELAVMASFDRAPFLLPGITTLSDRTIRRGHLPGSGSGQVVLVIDDSGSTSGDVLLREKEAAFAVVAAARAFGDPVGCVVFGSSITHSIEPTTHHHTVEDLILSLRSESGATQLLEGLEAAVGMMGERQEGAILIMTDAGIWDLDRVATLAAALPPGIRTVTFCFGDPAEIEGRYGRMARDGFQIFAASPQRPFAESALEEIYG